jgi:foldase protein PrsA
MSLHARPVRTALVVCALGIPTALALTGCGGSSGLPSDAVAKIDGTTITKSAYNDSMKFLDVQASQQFTGGKLFSAANPQLISFTAPYTNCIAAIKKTVPKTQKVTDAQIKQACQQTEQQLKDGALSQLLTEKIISSEAAGAKITVTDAEITKALPADLTQKIGGQQNLAKFTKLTGLKEDTLRDDVRNQLLSTKLQAKISKDAGPVTDADVQAAYNKNKAQYAQPESRNLHVVLTKTEADANKAKKALQGGQSFATVAKQYSTDKVTKAAGGKLSNVVKGQQEKGLETAAFAAQTGKLVGPVKTESGYYVLRVDKVTPAKQVPFSQVQKVLKQQLQQQKPADALTKWSTDITKKWKAKTDCRVGYNTVQFCKNMPAPKTTAAAGAAAPAPAPAPAQ